MNLSQFIAKRIGQQQTAGFSSTVHKIAVWSVGLGLAAMIISFLVMTGFKKTIQSKIFDFSGHLDITRYSENRSLEQTPMNFKIDVYNNAASLPYVEHIQEFAHKAGLIKMGDEVLGVFVKGVGTSFDAKSFRDNILEGEFLDFSDSAYSKEVVLSRIISDKIGVGVGEDIVIHFFQDPPRSRKLKVSGIYETNLSEYIDNRIILGDIRLIQRLNGWSDSIAGGLQVFVTDVDKIDEVGASLFAEVNYDLEVTRVSDEYIQVFEWLGLIDRQVNMVFYIILAVICLNIGAIIVILVMERTQMIGILKALGSSHKVIRSIFIYRGINLLVKGLVLGNSIGLGLCYLQYRFNIVELKASDYYMNEVPIGWDWGVVLILNAATFLLVMLVMYLLVLFSLISISPIKAIRFN